MSKYNPFEANVEPYDRAENAKFFPMVLDRQCMWDLVGDAMIKEPERFDHTPASPDVVDMEYRDMVMRKRALMPFGQSITHGCAIAATAATRAILAVEPKAANLSEEERSMFLAENIRISTAVTNSVISQMLTSGLLHYGAHQ